MSDISVVERGGAKDQLGEGPYWPVREQALYWVDILGERINRLSLKDGSVRYWQVPEMIGWLIERRNAPGFVADLASGVKAVTFDTLTFTDFTALAGETISNRTNDAKADAYGNLWAGTTPIDGRSATGSLYRIDPDRRVTRVDSGYVITNGPAISPDGQWLYHTDSAIRHIYRFPLYDDGTLGTKEIFRVFDERWGLPDGMIFDAEGGLWVARWGGSQICRFDPDARIERSIKLPASKITSMAFGGENFDRLFVTSASDGVD